MTRPLTAIVLTFLGLAHFVGHSLPGAKHDTWVEVRSPNFIVVSNAGEKQARKTAIRLEQMRAVFRQSLELAKEHESAKVTMLAVKDEDSDEGPCCRNIGSRITCTRRGCFWIK